jgi:uracil-DNA glycosylase
MWFERLWEVFQKSVFSLPSIEDENGGLFNPYHEVEARLDRPGGETIRQGNLLRYLESLPAAPPILIVGEAPGWRGCRFSGVPFTSEAQLVSGTLPFKGRASSLSQHPYNEASATIFWGIMQAYHPDFFIWNCLPLHPHPAGHPLSNRPPTRTEQERFLPLLAEIIADLAPKKVLALGIKAQGSLEKLDVRAFPVRHPAHGGATAFRLGIESLLRASV